MTPEDIATLRTLIERMNVGMLTTVDAEGMLRSRPMLTLAVDFDGRLWFFVSAESPKIDEMRHEHGQLGIAYADPAKQDYVSISGRGEIVYDRERMKALWTPWANMWFPDGVDDPSIALLRVTIEQAEYWEAPGSAVKRFYGLVKARATGDPTAMGEHRKIHG